MTVERWQSGPIEGVAPHLMPVAHALLQVVDDVAVAGELDADRLWATPAGAASVGWHLLHLAGSTDRLLTYAQGHQLDDRQRAELALERDLPEPRPAVGVLLARLEAVVAAALDQLRATPDTELLAPREVGRARVPSNVLGLLFHAAEHAARHAGQVVTTIKVLNGHPWGPEAAA